MADDLYPAVGPAWGWTALGVVLLAATVGWWSWIWLATRTSSRRRRAGAAVPVEELRRWALGEVDALAAAHRDARLDDRDVSQRLSALVRRFVFEASGSPAHVRSLAELRGETDGELAATIEWLYPEEFAADPDGGVEEGFSRARAYLRRWRS